jgi:prevent-host-death family protein
MPTIGAFEAKTHFSQLLDKVAHGEEIIITRHGEPVAKLIPAQSTSSPEQARKLIAEIKELRRGVSLGGVSIQALIHEGHKY